MTDDGRATFYFIRLQSVTN